jgi:adenylate kinase
MVVILLGPPGVGKGTQAVRLADTVGWEHVSTGDLLRAARREGTELGAKAQRYMDAGELVPDELILDLVRDHLKGIAPEAGILFDGFPRTTAQADGLERVLRAVHRRVDRVVVFEASEEELVKRLSGRRSCPDCGAVFNVHFTPPAAEGRCDRCGGTLVQREDDKPETVRHRLEVYREQTAPLIDWYEASDARVVPVSAEASVDEVHRSFRKAVGY